MMTQEDGVLAVANCGEQARISPITVRTEEPSPSQSSSAARRWKSHPPSPSDDDDDDDDDMSVHAVAPPPPPPAKQSATPRTFHLVTRSSQNRVHVLMTNANIDRIDASYRRGWRWTRIVAMST